MLPSLLDQRSLLCQSGVVLRPVVSMRWQWCRAFASRRIWYLLMQVSRAWEKHRALRRLYRQVPKLCKNSVDDASTLKPSCKRGSRACKKPSRTEVVKRERRNVGPRTSSHNICLKDVSGDLPIGSAARKISEWSLDVRLECRTRAVKICKASVDPLSALFCGRGCAVELLQMW